MFICLLPLSYVILHMYILFCEQISDNIKYEVILKLDSSLIVCIYVGVMMHLGTCYSRLKYGLYSLNVYRLCYM